MLTESIHRTVQFANAWWLRAGQLVSQARDGNRRKAALPAAGLVIIVLGGGGLWLASGDRGTTTAVGLTKDEAWRYLIVCGECGHRRRLADSPHDALEDRGGLLQCPHCDKFAVSWYRRGGLSLPPNGWEVPSP